MIPLHYLFLVCCVLCKFVQVFDVFLLEKVKMLCAVQLI